MVFCAASLTILISRCVEAFIFRFSAVNIGNCLNWNTLGITLVALDGFIIVT